ncbi:signal peptidase I [Pyrococcus furiosus DSM 3638]|uniref:Signal peptidase I n=3 Tax=Pyrococcus furiosus TaxID=2261 RepID=A0A5C0XMV6_PYRFU|nr:signal peptidase I [Pyrococcus furiosus]AAL80450.1 hypothetical protein PF0326 [Pyrococcus furiosus DSM 3638]AFN03115.1 hypothetical protein PFC_00710 [Pyrococcus furiosus COM1]QEK78042.1 signal peptidase I [Pyrococcus furiosus DSM 3638]
MRLRASDVLMLLVLGGVVFPSVAGYVMGRPIFVSYVYSNSMYPTLKKWDVFFINPLSKGNVGDIVVFNLSGSWTVHRVYAITSEGYITKGDNNVATDQQGGKGSPIPENQVIGKVITLGEKPLKIPKLGKYLASSKSKLPIVFLGLGALLLLPEKNRRKRRRRGVTISTTATYLIVISILTAGFFIVGTTNWRIINISYASTLGGGERENWYLPGSVVEKNITVQNFAKYRMIGVVEGKIINKTTFALNGGDKVMLPATIIVPNETRIYTEKIRVYMYYPLLPTGVVERMFEKSPYLPLAVEAMIVFLGLLVLKPLLIGDEEEIIIGRFRR